MSNESHGGGSDSQGNQPPVTVRRKKTATVRAALQRILVEQETIRESSRVLMQKRQSNRHKFAPERIRAVARRRRILLGILLALIPIAAVIKYQAEDATRALVVRSLESALGEDLAYGKIDLSEIAGGSLSIGSLSWGNCDSRSPMLHVGRVCVEVDRESIIRGQAPRITAMEFEGLAIHISRDGDGSFNIMRALRNRPAATDGAELGMKALPDVLRIRNGSLAIMDRKAMRAPIEISSIDLELRLLSTDASGVATREIHGTVADAAWGSWNITGKVTQHASRLRIEELRLEVSNLEVTRAIACRLQGSLLKIWRALEPRGTIDQLTISFIRGQQDHLEANVEVNTTKLRLPLVEAVLGESIGQIAMGVTVDDDVANFSINARGAIGRGAENAAPASEDAAVLFALSGEAAVGAVEHATMHVEATGVDLAGRLQLVAPQVRRLIAALQGGSVVAATVATGATTADAVPDPLMERLDRLNLAGRASVAADIRMLGDSARPEYSGRVRLCDVSLQVPGAFELIRADSINGDLVFSGSTLSIPSESALTARIGGNAARVVSGAIRDIFKRDKFTHELVVEMPGLNLATSNVLPLLTQIIERASPGGDSKFLNRLRESTLAGAFDLNVHVQGGARTATHAVDFDLRSAAGIQLSHPGFPCTVAIAGGQVHFSGRAPEDGGKIDWKQAGIGLSDLRASTPYGSLSGSGLIRPGIGASLTLDCPELALRPELHARIPLWAKRTWDALHMEQSLGLTTTLDWQRDRFSAAVAARGAHISPLEIKLDDVAGNVRWDGRELSITNFSGVGLGGKLEAQSGRLILDGVSCASGTSFDLSFRGKGLDLRHPRIIRLIGGKAATGAVNPGGDADIAGSLSVQRWDPKTLRVETAIAVPRLELKGRAVEDARAQLRYENEIVTLTGISGRLHGGRIAGEARLALGSFRAFQGVLQVERVQLAEVVAAAVKEPDARVVGHLDGQIHFSGVLGSLESLEGMGYLRVNSGWLHEMPAPLARMDTPTRMNNSAGMNPATRSATAVHGANPSGVFRTAGADFTFHGLQVTIQSSTLGGSKVGLHAFGDLHLTGKLDMNVLVGANTHRDYSAALRQAPAGFRVSGSFADPKVEIQLFPGLGGLFDDLGYALGSDL